MITASHPLGEFLAVQWLGLCTSTAGGPGLIPGWETKIPEASHLAQNKNRKTILWMQENFFKLRISFMFKLKM